MDSMNDSAAQAAAPRSSRGRRILVGIVFLLACLSILVSTVALWTHQVAFKTERFTALVEQVVTDPAVIVPVSGRVSDQVVDALDLQARIEGRLPDAVKALAGPITLAVRDGIDKRLQVALADPRLHDALVQSLLVTHAQVMRLLRDEADAINVVDGYVTLDVFPVVGRALAELQSIGLIPSEVQLPDLSAPEAPAVLADRLEAALGITLPDTFGTVQLMPADRLVAARTVVRAFDFVVIALIVLSVLLVGLTLWLARSRRRMLVYLAIGTVVAFLLARLAIRGAEGVLVDGIADQGVAGAVRSVLDATLADLRGLTTLVLIGTVIVAIAAYLSGRPAWLARATSAAGDAAGRAGSTAVAAGSAGVAAAGRTRPSGEIIERTVREQRRTIERGGIAVIVFVLVWLAAGLEIALLGAALLIGLELLLGAIGGEGEVPSGSGTGAGTGTSSGFGTAADQAPPPSTDPA